MDKKEIFKTSAKIGNTLGIIKKSCALITVGLAVLELIPAFVMDRVSKNIKIRR